MALRQSEGTTTRGDMPWARELAERDIKVLLSGVQAKNHGIPRKTGKRLNPQNIQMQAHQSAGRNIDANQAL